MKNIILLIVNIKGYMILNAVIQKKLNDHIKYVVSYQDSEVEKDYYHDIKILAEKNNIEFIEYKKGIINDINSEKTIFIAIGWQKMIDNRHNNLFVIHDSLLPKYRGFAPLVNALKNGEEYVGATLFVATNEYDKGDIVEQMKVKVNYPVKIYDMINIIGNLYIELTINFINNYIENKIVNVYKQNEKDATYSQWLDDKDYIIKWNNTSEEIKRFIDSVGFPYKGAISFINKKPVRIMDAEIVSDYNIENREPGKIFRLENGCPIIVCGKGLIKITKMISENDKSNMIPFKKLKTRFCDDSLQ